MTGWTIPEIRAAPAGACDWLLRIDRLMAEVAAEFEPGDELYDEAGD